MDKAGLGARGATLHLLWGVLVEGRQMPEGGLPGLTPSDQARARRLALHVLRNLARCDAVLEPFLQKAPPPGVLNILRLAVAELALDAGQAHGVVSAAVDLARGEKGGAAFSGLVNAVLRKVAAKGDVFGDLAAPVMAPWLRGAMIKTWDKKVVQAIEAVQALAPPLDLTLKPGAGVDIPEAVALPNGSLRLAGSVQVSALPGYATGDWWVQDAAAAMAVPLLDPKPGEKVLDLCAAPGGKTMQLAATGADVTAVDMSPARMAVLAENLKRTGLAATLVEADLRKWQPDGLFDAILLDAPCSATGTLRRHPDLPFAKGADQVKPLVALQAELLDRALAWLAPGGRLVFVTCSLLPEEGEKQLAGALRRHPGLTVERPAMDWVDAAWITPEGGLRLRPDHWADKGGMDGFFMARFRRV
jgi:16S rRNA (cytosine967-C5)-methyltransferase